MPSILIVGGLTIDEFADGRRAPGGSVIYAGLAAVAAGADVTTFTVTGPEPEAASGLERLASFGPLVAAAAPATTTYGHAEVEGRRVLALVAAGGRVTVDRGAAPLRPDVVLFAPIADELAPDTVTDICDATRPPVTAFLIQGWLRRLDVGQPVRPAGLDDVAADAWRAFGAGTLVVVSTEDLADGADDPFAQAAALRVRLGPRPILVVTLGPEGYLLDDPRADRITATVPRRVVSGAPTVGAGDTFGVVMALRLAAGADSAAAADAGTDAVIALLESRR
jgi:sugar/nucleoside kinase (ribokinase family)